MFSKSLFNDFILSNHINITYLISSVLLNIHLGFYDINNMEMYIPTINILYTALIISLK